MTTNDKLADALVQVPREALELIANSLPLKHNTMPYAMEALGFAQSEAREALAAHAASLAAPPAQGEWAQGAPSKPWSEEWFIAVTKSGDRVVLRALPESYTYDFTTADDTHIKRDRIAKWMQFPDSEFIAPQPAPAPVQVDDGWHRMTQAARDMQARHLDNHQGDVYHAMQSLVGRFGAPRTGPMIQDRSAQPPAPGEAELPARPSPYAGMDGTPAYPPLPKPQYAFADLEGEQPDIPAFSVEQVHAMIEADRAAIAALAQQRVHVPDEMVERACKKYAFREDGALFPDDYSPHEVAAERVLMREFLTHVINQQQEARGNGE